MQAPPGQPTAHGFREPPVERAVRARPERHTRNGFVPDADGMHDRRGAKPRTRKIGRRVRSDSQEYAGEVDQGSGRSRAQVRVATPPPEWER
jgi:hypothetical protein